MNDQELTLLRDTAERLHVAIHGVSASQPSGDPEWTNEDAEHLARLAKDAGADVQHAAQAARHGLLNVRRILLATREYGRQPEKDRIDVYRQYHLYTVLALFRVIEGLSPDVEVPAEPDNVLSHFRTWIRTFSVVQ